MSEPKYNIYTTDTSVTIKKRGVKGSLTFGVGGPIAAKMVSDLCSEVNALESALAAAKEAAEYLMSQAQLADDAHERTEQKFQKWIKTKKGGKPAPAVALPYAANVMRNAANHIIAARAALAAVTDEEAG